MSTLDHRDVVVLLIDAQTEFLKLSSGQDELIHRTERLLFLADLLDLPVVASSELPLETKGELPERLRAALPATASLFTKATFDCLGNPAIRDHLAGLNRPAVAVAGGETDVCVLLSVLSLLEAGYRVHVLEDCLFTSSADPQPALARMRAAGAVPTTVKTLGFELTKTVDRTQWPAAWIERLAARPHLFPPPEDLAAE